MTPISSSHTLESFLEDYTAIEIVTALNEIMLSALLNLHKEPESLTDIIGSYETVYAVRNLFLSKIPVR